MALNSNFVKPQYGAGSFAALPYTIKHLLNSEPEPQPMAQVFEGLAGQYEAVVFFLIDGLGWRFFERFQDHPFLQHIATEGRVAQLTSQFPSTTAAHVTCIHTGLRVGQSGIFEWQFYEPLVDDLITPLLFSYAGTKKLDTLKPTNLDPQEIYPTQTIYQELQAQGIPSYLFQPQAIAHSTYSRITSQGAKPIGYKTLPEALVNLQHLLGQQKSKSYYFLYFGTIDAISHEYGPDSPQVEAEIDALLTTLQRLFLQRLNGQPGPVLFMMTADHGQIEVDPATTIYLNRGSQSADIHKFLRHNKRGQPIIPGGSARDMFLYIKDDMLDEAQDYLAQRLAAKADVYQVQSLIDQEFFGPLPVSPTFLSRVGNLVVLPHPHETVWWYEKDKFEMEFYGHHGGLTPQEMEIPLLVYDPRGL